MDRPTMMPTGEIDFPDGTKMLIPQPVQFTSISPLDDFYITMPQLPSATMVDLYIEEQAHLAPKPTEDPAWAVLCVLLGALLLVATGVLLATMGAMR